MDALAAQGAWRAVAGLLASRRAPPPWPTERVLVAAAAQGRLDILRHLCRAGPRGGTMLLDADDADGPQWLTHGVADAALRGGHARILAWVQREAPAVLTTWRPRAEDLLHRRRHRGGGGDDGSSDHGDAAAVLARCELLAALRLLRFPDAGNGLCGRKRRRRYNPCQWRRVLSAPSDDDGAASDDDDDAGILLRDGQPLGVAAAATGHVEVLEWLAARGLLPPPTRWGTIRALRAAGSPAVAEWLLARWTRQWRGHVGRLVWDLADRVLGKPERAAASDGVTTRMLVAILGNARLAGPARVALVEAHGSAERVRAVRETEDPRDPAVARWVLAAGPGGRRRRDDAPLWVLLAAGADSVEALGLPDEAALTAAASARGASFSLVHALLERARARGGDLSAPLARALAPAVRLAARRARRGQGTPLHRTLNRLVVAVGERGFPRLARVLAAAGMRRFVFARALEGARPLLALEFVAPIGARRRARAVIEVLDDCEHPWSLAFVRAMLPLVPREALEADLARFRVAYPWPVPSARALVNMLHAVGVQGLAPAQIACAACLGASEPSAEVSALAPAERDALVDQWCPAAWARAILAVRGTAALQESLVALAKANRAAELRALVVAATPPLRLPRRVVLEAAHAASEASHALLARHLRDAVSQRVRRVRPWTVAGIRPRHRFLN